MTDEQGYCTERTPSDNQRPHVCRRTNNHLASHACTCGFTWRWIDEHKIPTIYPDIEYADAE